MEAAGVFFKPWLRVEAAGVGLSSLGLRPRREAAGGFSSSALTLGKPPGANQRNWHRNIIWQQTYRRKREGLRQQAGQERAKGGSCRGVFQTLDWDQGWKLQGVFKPCVEVLTKGTGIETPCGNRCGWKREGLRQQAGQERGKSRCGKGGVFFKPLGFSWLAPATDRTV